VLLWPEQTDADVAVITAVGIGTAAMVIDCESDVVHPFAPAEVTPDSEYVVVVITFGITSDAVPAEFKMMVWTAPPACEKLTVAFGVPVKSIVADASLQTDALPENEAVGVLSTAMVTDWLIGVLHVFKLADVLLISVYMLFAVKGGVVIVAKPAALNVVVSLTPSTEYATMALGVPVMVTVVV